MKLAAALLAPLLVIGLFLSAADAQEGAPPPAAPFPVRGGAEPSALLEVARGHAAARGLALHAKAEVEGRLAETRRGAPRALARSGEETLHVASRTGSESA